MQAVSRQFDRLVLYSLHQRMPSAFEQSAGGPPTLARVLEETTVNHEKTAEYDLLAPGERTVWLDSATGEIRCHVTVRLAVNPQAPLFLYHHGFNEIPYTGTWQRLFPKARPFPAHSVAVQAPFHNNMTEPTATGFASIRNILQMFAGSMRVMQLVQEAFERNGAAFTLAGGLSWGGITSLLYESVFQSTRAVVPMYASPNLAQVLWDASQLFDRPLPVSRETLYELFDFTPLHESCMPERLFPVLGESDLFFRFDKHAAVFPEDGLLTVPTGHVGGSWQMREQLRRHILAALEWAAASPR